MLKGDFQNIALLVRTIHQFSLKTNKFTSPYQSFNSLNYKNKYHLHYNGFSRPRQLGNLEPPLVEHLKVS